jgi:ribonucleoside-triphosphate reductase
MDALTIEKKLATLKAELASVQGTPTEVYSRIVGYYRSVKNWNAGKRDEFAHRVTFRMPSGVPSALGDPAVGVGSRESNARPEAYPSTRAGSGPASYVLFTRKTCPNCPADKNPCPDGLPGTEHDVDTHARSGFGSEIRNPGSRRPSL